MGSMPRLPPLHFHGQDISAHPIATERRAAYEEGQSPLKSVRSYGFQWRFLKDPSTSHGPSPLSSRGLKSQKQFVEAPAQPSKTVHISGKRRVEAASETTARAARMHAELELQLESLRQGNEKMRKTAELAPKISKYSRSLADDPHKPSVVPAPANAQDVVGAAQAGSHVFENVTVEEHELESAQVPCMMWSNAFRVRVANDLPPALQAANNADGSHVPQVIPDPWDTNVVPVKTAGSLTARRASSKYAKYGAWYVPSERWIELMDGRFERKDIRDEQTAKLDKLQEELSGEVHKLHSTKSFKSFLEKKGARFPQFLQNEQPEIHSAR